jgi:PIN domain nuclease of toxin-antitoxin system
VRLLIDTHALVWWLTANPRLSHAAEAAITDPLNQLYASACAGYEIMYKQQLRRLPPMPSNLPDSLRRDRIIILPISLDHAITAAVLPGPHRDPWDRIMMAQARIEALTVVTIDQVFATYGVPTLW